MADMMSRPKWLVTAAAALAVCWTGCAAAQSPAYPSRAVTLIVPFPAGGGVDAVARIVAEKMAGGLGQQVIIDNRGGVAGVIGMRVAARAGGRPGAGRLSDGRVAWVALVGDFAAVAPGSGRGRRIAPGRGLRRVRARAGRAGLGFARCGG